MSAPPHPVPGMALYDRHGLDTSQNAHAMTGMETLSFFFLAHPTPPPPPPPPPPPRPARPPAPPHGAHRGGRGGAGGAGGGGGGGGGGGVGWARKKKLNVSMPVIA